METLLIGLPLSLIKGLKFILLSFGAVANIMYSVFIRFADNLLLATPPVPQDHGLFFVEPHVTFYQYILRSRVRIEVRPMENDSTQLYINGDISVVIMCS